MTSAADPFRRPQVLSGAIGIVLGVSVGIGSAFLGTELGLFLGGFLALVSAGAVIDGIVEADHERAEKLIRDKRGR